MITSSEELGLAVGSTIRGKWRNRAYTIVRTLGAGSNGTVFLVNRGGTQYALKVGYDSVDLMSEVNALRTLSKSTSSFHGMLIDVDDVIVSGKEYPFFVMKFHEGTTIASFLQKHGSDWLYLIGMNLLRKLQELHDQGYVFGDLKMENIIVSSYGHVELIDFGGMTAKGRSVKQFTELYDRGFWGAGSRVAEDSYDLFAFAILIMRTVDTQDSLSKLAKGLPQNRNLQDLKDFVDRSEKLNSAKMFLHQAISGQLNSTRAACEAWRKLLPKTTSSATKSGSGSWLPWCFALSIVLLGVTVYLYWP
ncbi:protein kinase domain-containing protein [Paenibacillus albiflavus]|uniref:protein kinase domain-containing protein n=1 Tax=Paenibacillus albiflavus TaxID=2545760 RepID=UPI001F1CA275|nr:protein kinase [Paenibacillus albiflavus]